MTKKGKEYYSSIKKEINIKVVNRFEKDIMDNELKVTYLYSIITNNEEIFNKEIKEHTIIV